MLQTIKIVEHEKMIKSNATMPESS
uniref:Uncharacterized protein n=1 Tax=Rhizophora mucronata TaxID=61149 RepID=A0A2P2QM60_RHIMU